MQLGVECLYSVITIHTPSALELHGFLVAMEDSMNYTFSQKGRLIFRVFLMYTPRSLLALPPPEERNPNTMSTTSSVSRRRSTERSSSRISCCTRCGSGTWTMKVCVNYHENNSYWRLLYTRFWHKYSGTNLWINLFPHSSKSGSSIYILPVHYLRDI